jgi:hypothetical protein
MTLVVSYIHDVCFNEWLVCALAFIVWEWGLLSAAIPHFPSGNSQDSIGLKKVRAYYDYV